MDVRKRREGRRKEGRVDGDTHLIGCGIGGEADVAVDPEGLHTHTHPQSALILLLHHGTTPSPAPAPKPAPTPPFFHTTPHHTTFRKDNRKATKKGNQMAIFPPQEFQEKFCVLLTRSLGGSSGMVSSISMIFSVILSTKSSQFFFAWRYDASWTIIELANVHLFQPNDQCSMSKPLLPSP